MGYRRPWPHVDPWRRRAALRRGDLRYRAFHWRLGNATPFERIQPDAGPGLGLSSIPTDPTRIGGQGITNGGLPPAAASPVLLQPHPGAAASGTDRSDGGLCRLARHE